MFTGIVEAKGTVVRVEHLGQVKRLTLEIPAGLTEISLGDSINVNGACLTVVGKKGQGVTVDVSAETLQRTTFGTSKRERRSIWKGPSDSWTVWEATS